MSSALLSSSRHRPRDGGGHYSSRELPEDLAESLEAADVWAAARSVAPNNKFVEVRGWRVEWRPRLGGGKTGKQGDMYIFPPCDESYGWGKPIRSLSALHDILILRLEAQLAGSAVWSPPMRGSLVEVRLQLADETPGGADEASTEEWRRAEVRKVEPSLGGSFQVVIHTADGEPDESLTRWCTAWNENDEWRRIAGQSLFARSRPGKRVRRCGACAGCRAQDCGVCNACRDKPKFGGPGTAKQACSKRRCSKPVVPTDSDGAAGNGNNNSSGAAATQAYAGGPEETEYEHAAYAFVANGGAAYDQEVISESFEQGMPLHRPPSYDDEDDEDDDDAEDDDDELGGGVEESSAVEGGSEEEQMASLRRQLARAHKRARKMRKSAIEVMRYGRAVYPLAHAAQPGLEPPDCFIAPLPPLPRLL